MQRAALVILAFIAALSTALAGDCEMDGHSFDLHDKYKPANECAQYTCVGQGHIVGKTCVAQIAPDYCSYIPEDVSKPYPACCPRYDCNSKNES